MSAVQADNTTTHRNGVSENIIEDIKKSDDVIKIDANGNLFKNGCLVSTSSGEDDSISSTSDSRDEDDEECDTIRLKTR